MNNRAARRNEERRLNNQLARERAEVRVAPPARARHTTELRLLAGRGTISDAQARAGERLYADWFNAGRSPRVVANLSPVSGQPPMEAQERQFDAERRFTAAIRAVGQLLSPILVHVCLLDEKAGQWAKTNGRPEGDGHALLRAALDGLVGYYAGN